MYHQVQGTAMEPLICQHICCIWPGPPSELDHFMQYLNQSHPTIKFTHESSTHSVDFLDLTIYKGQRHTASDTKPFFKATNKFQHLEYSSANPKGTFASLDLTRLLRARKYTKAAQGKRTKKSRVSKIVATMRRQHDSRQRELTPSPPYTPPFPSINTTTPKGVAQHIVQCYAQCSWLRWTWQCH